MKNLYTMFYKKMKKMYAALYCQTNADIYFRRTIENINFYRRFMTVFM